MRQPRVKQSRADYIRLRNDPERWQRHLELQRARRERYKDKQNQQAREKRAKAKIEKEKTRTPEEIERNNRKNERNRQYRLRNKEKMNKQQRAKYLVERAVQKKALLTPEERAERRRLSNIKYSALRAEKRKLEKINNPKPSRSKQALAISGASRRMAEINNYSTDSRLMGIKDAANYLDLSVSELIMAGLKGEAPRPAGVLHNGETAYTIADVREYKHQRKNAA